MGRNVKPGISFYRMDSGHILDKKVRLLVNEFDSDGYYIWRCIEDYAYSNYGYYFPTIEKDELELFASEYCKKKLSLVKEVIQGCIRRGLFDHRVAGMFGVLTSEAMQHTFLIATADRRRNGAVFTLIKDYMVIPEQIEVSYANIAFCYVTNEDRSRNKNPDKIREDKIRVEVSKSHSGAKTPNNLVNNIEKKVPPLLMPEEPANKSGIPAKRVIRKQPPVEYWKLLIEVWFTFYGQHFRNEETGEPAKPDFDKVQGNLLRNIILKLKSQANWSQQSWTEKQAITCLNKFLQKAWDKDAWLRDHFELANLVSKFNSIINTNEATQQAPGTAAKGSISIKQPTGADLITARLKQNLQCYAATGGADNEG